MKLIIMDGPIINLQKIYLNILFINLTYIYRLIKILCQITCLVLMF